MFFVSVASKGVRVSVSSLFSTFTKGPIGRFEQIERDVALLTAKWKKIFQEWSWEEQTRR
jgi:hypothetical protein